MAITDETTSQIQKEHNFMEAIKRDLERSIKDAVLNDLMKQQLAEYEEKIRPIIREHVEKLTFDGIYKMNDMMHLRDELQLYLHWNDEEKMKKFYKVDKVTETEIVDK